MHKHVFNKVWSQIKRQHVSIDLEKVHMSRHTSLRSMLNAHIFLNTYWGLESNQEPYIYKLFQIEELSGRYIYIDR